MDLRRNINLILLLVLLGHHVKGENVVFNVKHKFGGRGGVSLKELKAHDVHRHGRMLGAADFQLGGNGSPTSSVLYFTKLSIGTPSKDYHVQVDTGSDLLWLSCAGCDNCPKESTLRIDMAQYNLQASTSGKSITCDQDVCATMFEATSSDCKVGKPCEYMVTYGDGSTSGGHFVKDNINLDQVSAGDNKTSPLQGNVTFGCSSKQSGGLGTSTNAVDGIIGFGAAKTSVISQLAAAGTVKRVFSHCLNGNSGGGIFAIGQLVEPKVNTTPLLTNRQHYTVSLKNIEVDGEVLNIPTSIFESKYSEAAIIDSGTTLAYLPSNVYNAVMGKLMAKQPKLKTHHHEGNFECFSYSGNVDNDFPVVSFKFMGNLTLTAYPHDYLFKLHDGDWCIGWQEGIEGKDGDDLFLLGDLVLSNKLFVYDLEKKTLGWTQYDCSSNIKVKDDSSENVYTVGAHNISSASTTTFTLFLSLISFLCYFFN